MTLLVKMAHLHCLIYHLPKMFKQQRRRIMQNWKTMVIPILAPALLFTSHRILAQEAPINTVPDFYFLEESGDRDGEVVRVYACHENSPAGETSLNRREPGSPMRTLGLDCSATIEVDKEDLHHFVANLGLEMESLRKDYRWTEGKGILSVFIGFVSLISIGVTGTELFEIAKGLGLKNINAHTLKLNRTLILVFASSLAGLATSATWFKGMMDGHPYSVRQHLRDQIRRGLVTKVKHRHGSIRSNYGREILGLFTDFLNQYGRRVSSIAQVE